MTYQNEKKVMLTFVRLFLVLFVILFILPGIIDGLLNMFVLYQQPSGNSMLVSKPLYENLKFGHKYLLILKNIIISL
ncbi:MAG TPA: hypothetical protein VEF53_21740 [Patescibacteria group bacterium]|jgi:hypothetical protein|nr:hypothetical protein [Patescibacteria group bacterium]